MLKDAILADAETRVRDAVGPLSPEARRTLLLDLAAEPKAEGTTFRFSAEPLIGKCEPSLVDQARIFATAAHAAVGQKRKYTGRPYIEHPAAVVEILKSVDHTPEMLAAGWLHDVVEDTEIRLDLIEEFFGGEIKDLVLCLTEAKDQRFSRSTLKGLYRDFISRAPAAAQTIKLADLIHNTASIVARDPKFASVYLTEKEALLEALTRGDPQLLERARAQVKDAREQLACDEPPGSAAPIDDKDAIVNSIDKALRDGSIPIVVDSSDSALREVLESVTVTPSPSDGEIWLTIRAMDGFGTVVVKQFHDDGKTPTIAGQVLQAWDRKRREALGLGSTAVGRSDQVDVRAAGGNDEMAAMVSAGARAARTESMV